MFQKGALFLIRFYQERISPLTRPSCRFCPTCSTFSYVSFEKWGFRIGFWMTLVRLLKCHPLHPGGKEFSLSKES